MWNGGIFVKERRGIQYLFNVFPALTLFILRNILSDIWDDASSEMETQHTFPREKFSSRFSFNGEEQAIKEFCTKNSERIRFYACIIN